MRGRAEADTGARGRIVLVLLACVAVYGAIGARLVTLGMETAEARASVIVTPQDEAQAARPDIVDRNGEVLATDLATASLYAEPRLIVNVDEAVEKLIRVLPELDPRDLRDRLSNDRGFVWLKREISARERAAVHDLGIPGVGFITETRRFYPGRSAVGHIVGHVNVDNAGIAGMEKAIDDEGLAALQAVGLARKGRGLAPVRLSVDLRVQHAVRDELSRAIERYQAKAAVGIVLDARTFEVVAMVSLPDYDPNDPKQSFDEKRMNRAVTGVFELGSVFKAFTMAAALDAGVVDLDSRVDARAPIRLGGFTISDFRGQNRVLTVRETFVHSSNIGTTRVALSLGADRMRRYLEGLGLLQRIRTELPEGSRPLVPARWPDLTLATVSFGHGIAVTPMHLAAAAAAVLNGGMYARPTFYPRTHEETMEVARRVIGARASVLVRELFKANATEGSGRSARVPGYDVGGKTGTAEKAVAGGYATDERINTFLAAFPMDDPQYVTVVVLDDPRKAEGQPFATAGYNAAPTTANIIARIAPMLVRMPRFEDDDPVVRALDVAYQEE